jgi:hypothetical protein
MIKYWTTFTGVYSKKIGHLLTYSNAFIDAQKVKMKHFHGEGVG